MSGRHAPRSRNGCLTCKTRKLKCDEQRPQCIRCTNTRIRCDWDERSRPASRHVSSRTRKSPNNANHNQPLRTLYIQPVDNSPNSSRFRKRSTSYCGAISPPPATDCMHLSDLVVPSPIDREYFEYFPHCNLIRYLWKPWKWSMLGYIHREVAKKCPSVMAMVLAISASELHAKNTHSEDSFEHQSNSSDLDMGINYYRRALQDMSSLLKNDQQQLSQDRLHAIFATFFLMISYEQQFQFNSNGDSIHIKGVRSFLQTHFESPTDGQNRVSLVKRLPPLCRLLLLYILYYDIASRMRNKSAGQLLQDLHSNQDYEFCIDDLFRAGRSALPEIWGSIYPAEELLDDLENYRALELMHESIKFHFKISKQFVNEDNYDEHQDHNEDLQNHLESIREKYQDFFIMSTVASDITKPRRVVQNIYTSTAMHYGNHLLYHRLICRKTSSQGCHQAELSSLLKIAHEVVEKDCHFIVRLALPLYLAGLETDDVIYQDWIKKSFRRVECDTAMLKWFRRSLVKATNGGLHVG